MFTNRSSKKELIDLGPSYYSPDEYRDCLMKLFRVNKVLGFFNSTVKLLRSFSKNATIMDVGCGNGLFLLNLSRYYPDMKMVGVDINATAITEAENLLNHWKTNNLANNITFQLQTITPATDSVDIILATLMCHHLSDEELIDFLKTTYHNARLAVIIHDLHRHALSQWLYALVSPLLFKNRLISHDGYISIQRGFIRSEWQALLAKANISRYQIKWCFPFRWRVILWK